MRNKRFQTNFKEVRGVLGEKCLQKSWLKKCIYSGNGYLSRSFHLLWSFNYYYVFKDLSWLFIMMGFVSLISPTRFVGSVSPTSLTILFLGSIFPSSPKRVTSQCHACMSYSLNMCYWSKVWLSFIFLVITICAMK